MCTLEVTVMKSRKVYFLLITGPGIRFGGVVLVGVFQRRQCWQCKGLFSIWIAAGLCDDGEY